MPPRVNVCEETRASARDPRDSRWVHEGVQRSRRRIQTRSPPLMQEHINKLIEKSHYFLLLPIFALSFFLHLLHRRDVLLGTSLTKHSLNAKPIHVNQLQ